MVQGTNIDKNSEFKMQNAKLCGKNYKFLGGARENLGKLKNLGSLMSPKSTLPKLPNFSNLTKKSQWLIALFSFANSYPYHGAVF